MTVKDKQKMKEDLFRDIIKDLIQSEGRTHASKGGTQDGEASQNTSR